MIDLTDFNLKYICKTTKEVFAAKSTDRGGVVIVENGEKKTFTQWEARKRFKASKDNRKRGCKPAHALPFRAPKRVKIDSRKKYEEYLRESEEKLVSNYY